jgi:hypothetical protein
MTALVRADCPSCGPVDVRGVEVTILPCLAALAIEYRFRCPQCLLSVVRDVVPSLVMALLRAGAVVQPQRESSEFPYRAHPSTGLVNDYEHEEALRQWAARIGVTA